MKIGVYVLENHAKQTYKNESYHTRLYAGMEVVVDIIKRAGYQVEYVGKSTVNRCDVVLMSITSDSDWYPFIAERTQWGKGHYKVIVGGQGVLNVRPFLQFADYFVLGRAEGIIDKLITALDNKGSFDSQSVIESSKFNKDSEYFINQVDRKYPHPIKLQNGKDYEEDIIGCNHRCLFCGYTWHRKSVIDGAFEYKGLWGGDENRERAMLDIAAGVELDFTKLRTTAIDGLSQRLRFMVNKKITRDMIVDFIIKLHTTGKPHQVKLYNIIGYPTETDDDWAELAEDIAEADKQLSKTSKQTSLLLHSTPFRAMPATPLACKPMSYRNYRGEIARVLGAGYKGNIFYQGNAVWAVEGMGTEGLATVIQSAIVWRGTEGDADNIIKIAQSKKFKRASSRVKQATLEQYFDVKTLFGEYKPDKLPTRYLKTYANVEKMW